MTDYTIRCPWPDEISRMSPFLKGFKPKSTCAVRIAVTGRWERIIGVSALEERNNSDQIWIYLRPKYEGSELEAELKNAVISEA